MRVIVGNYFQVNGPSAFLAVPQLTLTVNGPSNHAVVTDPVRFSALASGVHTIREIKIWSNSKQVTYFKGAFFNGAVVLPRGANARVVLQAVDTQNNSTKVVLTLTVK